MAEIYAALDALEWGDIPKPYMTKRGRQKYLVTAKPTAAFWQQWEADRAMAKAALRERGLTISKRGSVWEITHWGNSPDDRPRTASSTQRHYTGRDAISAPEGMISRQEAEDRGLYPRSAQATPTAATIQLSEDERRQEIRARMQQELARKLQERSDRPDTLEPGVGTRTADSVALSHAVSSDIDLKAPAGKEYFPHQKAGIEYALQRDGTLIADTMGSGKTMMSFGVANNMPERPQRILVVAPKNVKWQWRKAAPEWLLDQYNIATVDAKWNVPDKGRVMALMHYDNLKKHADEIRKQPWDLLVLDESHYIKNPKAIRTKYVVGFDQRQNPDMPGPIEARKKLALTGTPTDWLPEDLWPTISYLSPGDWGDTNNKRRQREFVRRYTHYDLVGERLKAVGSQNAAELQNRLRGSVMISRDEAALLAGVPPKRRQVVVYEALTDAETEAVENEQRYARTLAGSDLGAVKADIAELSRLRHETALTKAPRVGRLAAEAVNESDRPVLVFSWHKDVLERVRETMVDEGGVAANKVEVIHGDVKPEDREKIFSDFQDNKYEALLATMATGGTGLNLQNSDRMIFAELDWQPKMLSQAEGRIFRPGQDRSVLIQHVVFDDSIDGYIASKLARKLQSADAMIGGTVRSNLVGTPEQSADPRFGFLDRIMDTTESGSKVTSDAGDAVVPEWVRAQSTWSGLEPIYQQVSNPGGTTFVRSTATEGKLPVKLAVTRDDGATSDRRAWRTFAVTSEGAQELGGHKSLKAATEHWDQALPAMVEDDRTWKSHGLPDMPDFTAAVEQPEVPVNQNRPLAAPAAPAAPPAPPFSPPAPRAGGGSWGGGVVLDYDGDDGDEDDDGDGEDVPDQGSGGRTLGSEQGFVNMEDLESKPEDFKRYIAQGLADAGFEEESDEVWDMMGELGGAETRVLAQEEAAEEKRIAEEGAAEEKGMESAEWDPNAGILPGAAEATARSEESDELDLNAGILPGAAEATARSEESGELELNAGILPGAAEATARSGESDDWELNVGALPGAPEAEATVEPDPYTKEAHQEQESVAEMLDTAGVEEDAAEYREIQGLDTTAQRDGTPLPDDMPPVMESEVVPVAEETPAEPEVVPGPVSPMGLSSEYSRRVAAGMAVGDVKEKLNKLRVQRQSLENKIERAESMDNERDRAFWQKDLADSKAALADFEARPARERRWVSVKQSMRSLGGRIQEGERFLAEMDAGPDQIAAWRREIAQVEAQAAALQPDLQTVQERAREASRVEKAADEVRRRQRAEAVEPEEAPMMDIMTGQIGSPTEEGPVSAPDPEFGAFDDEPESDGSAPLEEPPGGVLETLTGEDLEAGKAADPEPPKQPEQPGLLETLTDQDLEAGKAADPEPPKQPEQPGLLETLTDQDAAPEPDVEPAPRPRRPSVYSVPQGQELQAIQGQVYQRYLDAERPVAMPKLKKLLKKDHSDAAATSVLADMEAQGYLTRVKGGAVRGAEPGTTALVAEPEPVPAPAAQVASLEDVAEPEPAVDPEDLETLEAEPAADPAPVAQPPKRKARAKKEEPESVGGLLETIMGDPAPKRTKQKAAPKVSKGAGLSFLPETIQAKQRGLRKPGFKLVKPKPTVPSIGGPKSSGKKSSKPAGMSPPRLPGKRR